MRARPDLLGLSSSNGTTNLDGFRRSVEGCRARPMAAPAVRKALKVRGLTQRDVARICGVSEASVSMVVTGKIYSATIWGTILRLGRSPRKEAK